MSSFVLFEDRTMAKMDSHSQFEQQVHNATFSLNEAVHVSTKNTNKTQEKKWLRFRKVCGS